MGFGPTTSLKAHRDIAGDGLLPESQTIPSDTSVSPGREDFPANTGISTCSKVVAIGQYVACFEVNDWVFYGAYIGHNGWNVADQNSLLVKLLAGIDRKSCALLGVASVALRSVRRMRMGHGGNVFVVGQGPIRYLVAQMIRAASAKATVTDRFQKR